MILLSDIRAAIVAKLSSVAGIGVVHDYERFVADLAGLKQLYIDPGDGKLRGWHVRRVRTDETSSTRARYFVTHRWQIRGVQAIQDADQTEKSFDLLIEAFRDAVRADHTLGIATLTTITAEIAGVQVEDSGPAMFAGVLVHFARLTLATRHPVLGAN